MNKLDRTAFLPVSKEDMAVRGIEQLDFVYISGDAYVDHPSFGTAIISRILEANGFTVGIIAQPRGRWSRANRAGARWAGADLRGGKRRG